MQDTSGLRSGPYIPLSVPELRGREWEYVKECLDTNWVSSVGAFVDRFERMVAGYADAKFGVATVNSTAGLHIALLVAGVEPDDEVLVSTLTFIAPANAVRYLGAWPVFIDADPEYWQMDPEQVAGFLQTSCEWRDGALFNKQTGRRVKAIMPVHILGHPVDMDPILDLARRYELAVVEDASEGLGTRYKGRMVGHLGDIASFSFNGNKTITSGGGGVIVTDNREWADRAKYLTNQAKDDPVEYVHNAVGYNYRLTNIQAALGCAQVELLDEFIGIKKAIAGRYAEALAEVPGVSVMPEAPWAESTFWLYTVLVDEAAYGMNSRELLRRLESARIQARPLWQPMHRSPAHAGSPPTDCPVADRLHGTALSIPSSVGLTSEDQARVIDAIAKGAGGR